MIRTNRQICSMQYQKGIAMIVTLLLLIVMTLIVLASSRNTTMQLRMSSNLEARTFAMQQAQAGLDAVEKLIETPSVDVTESKYCTSYRPNPTKYEVSPTATCTTITDLKMAEFGLDTSIATATNWLVLENIGDLELPNCSDDTCIVTGWIVTSGYDGRSEGQGQVVLRMGAVKRKKE